MITDELINTLDIYLKSCPCCGHKTPEMRKNDVYGFYFDYYVKCPACGLRTSKQSKKDQAVARWNQQVNE